MHLLWVFRIFFQQFIHNIHVSLKIFSLKVIKYRLLFFALLPRTLRKTFSLVPLFCSAPWSARAGPPGATYDFARILIAMLTASAFLPLRSQAARVKENYCHRKFNQSGRIYPPGDPVVLIFHRVGRRIPFLLRSPVYPFFVVRDICVKTTYIVPAYNALRACAPLCAQHA